MFQSGDDTDIWFDDDWNWFDWSVEECKMWFSVWDWQETDLVGNWFTWDIWKMVQLY